MKILKMKQIRFITLWEEYFNLPFGKEEILNRLVKKGEQWRGQTYVYPTGLYFTRNFLDANRFRFYLQTSKNGPNLVGGEKIAIEKYLFFVEVEEIDNHARIRISYVMDNIARFAGPVGIGIIAIVAALMLLADSNRGIDLATEFIIGGAALIIALIHRYQKYYVGDFVGAAWPALRIFIDGMGWTEYQDREKYPAPPWSE